jgi:creatinine amidohydrolase
LPRLPASAPVWVAPSLLYGHSSEHADFTGTLSLTASSYRQVILAFAVQLKALGFRQLAVLNTHGGNSAALTYTLREIQATLGLRAGLLRAQPSRQLDAREAAQGFHASEWETSLMLACAPSLVRMDRAVCEYPPAVAAASGDAGFPLPDVATALHVWRTRDLSQSGVIGDPTRASAEQGNRWLDECATDLARAITGLLA